MKKTINVCDLCGATDIKETDTPDNLFEAMLQAAGSRKITHCPMAEMDVCTSCHEKVDSVVGPIVDEYKEKVKEVVNQLIEDHRSEREQNNIVSIK